MLTLSFSGPSFSTNPPPSTPTSWLSTLVKGGSVSPYPTKPPVYQDQPYSLPPHVDPPYVPPQTSLPSDPPMQTSLPPQTVPGAGPQAVEIVPPSSGPGGIFSAENFVWWKPVLIATGLALFGGAVIGIVKSFAK